MTVGGCGDFFPQNSWLWLPKSREQAPSASLLPCHHLFLSRSHPASEGLTPALTMGKEAHLFSLACCSSSWGPLFPSLCHQLLSKSYHTCNFCLTSCKQWVTGLWGWSRGGKTYCLRTTLFSLSPNKASIWPLTPSPPSLAGLPTLLGLNAP